MSKSTQAGRPTRAARPTTTWAIIHQRCPRCREGHVFRGPFSMNSRCPFCALTFEREPGYFIGAMAFSYAFAVGIVGILAFLINLIFPGMRLHWLLFTAGIAFLPFVPVVFRLSRVIWIHLDRAVDP